MKKLMSLAAAAMIVFTACAQKMNEKDVPSPVIKSFKDEHPGKTDVKWEKKGSNYMAKSKDSYEDFSALYDKDGNLLELEDKIEVSVLPTEVKVYCDQNAPGKTITEAYKIKDKNGKVVYDAVVEGTEYVFDSGGKCINKKAKKIRK